MGHDQTILNIDIGCPQSSKGSPSWMSKVLSLTDSADILYVSKIYRIVSILMDMIHT